MAEIFILLLLLMNVILVTVRETEGMRVQAVDMCQNRVLYLTEGEAE